MQPKASFGKPMVAEKKNKLSNIKLDDDAILAPLFPDLGFGLDPTISKMDSKKKSTSFQKYQNTG